MVTVTPTKQTYTRIDGKWETSTKPLPFLSPESDPLFVKLSKEFEQCLGEHKRVVSVFFDCGKHCQNFGTCEALWSAISGDCEDKKMLKKNYRIYHIVIKAWKESVAIMEGRNNGGNGL